MLWESATKSPFSSFTIPLLGRYPFLTSLMPLYKSLILFILLLVSSSSILPFKYAFFLFLKCLLASRLTLFRVSLNCNNQTKNPGVNDKHQPQAKLPILNWHNQNPNITTVEM